MYEAFYGFTEKPFVMTPDTRYFFSSPKHMEALNSMLYTVQERRGFVVITGEIGAGKTTVCRALFNRLDQDRVRLAVVQNTYLTAKDLITLVLEDLEIPYKPGTKGRLIAQLNDYLIDVFSTSRTVVLVIDEAQNLSPLVLEEVRMLSNLETEREKLIQIVLVGQPELRAKLYLRSLEQFRQRVTVHYHLQPLDATETEGYVRHRLQVAGANGHTVFAPEAFGRIYTLTGGVPRLINAVCDRALLNGYVQESKIVTAGLVEQAAQELPSLVDRHACPSEERSGP